ncbi:sugar phosphate nucleotidyltransferase [Chloroflexota bacterium]
MTEMKDSGLTAIILVGGLGTRLQPLTYYAPKPMVKLLNRPFLEHTIAYLKHHSIFNVVLAISYLPEVITNYFGNGQNFGVNLTYCVEDTPLGTAGAVKNAEEHLNNTFIVLNGDVFTDLDISAMLRFHREKQSLATIALTNVDNPSAFGVVETDTNQSIRRFVEKPQPGETDSHWINAGVYILEPEVLELVPKNQHYMFERGLFPDLLKKNKPFYANPFSGYWVDMGNPEKYYRLSCNLLEDMELSPLIAGVDRAATPTKGSADTLEDGVLEGQVVLGEDCYIGANVRITGPTVIGNGCHIDDNATVKHSLLWEGVRIGAGSHVEKCIISNHTNISPNTRMKNVIATSHHGDDKTVNESEDSHYHRA